MADVALVDHPEGEGEGTGRAKLQVASTSGLDLRTLSSVLFDRARFMRQAGVTFNGKRDSYDILGYPRVLSYLDFRARYMRGGLAKRLVEAFPKATWRGGVNLYEDEDPENETEFEKAWQELEKRLKIWTTLQRADILAGLSTYSVILIGAGDADLSLELPRGKGPESLLYLSPFSGGGGPWGGDRMRPLALDADTTIMAFDMDPGSSRYGLPLSYQLKRTSIDSPVFARPVHWSRIVHVAEGCLNDEIYGLPTLESVWNLLDDLDKVTGGGAEAFWLRANQGLHIDVDKDMQLDKTKDAVDSLKDQAEDYANGIQRWIRTRGTTVTPLGSNVADFKGPTDAIISQIAGAKGIPKRILVGSEMGQLASGQDADNWDTQVMDRRSSYAGPFIVRQLVDRLIEYKYLPQPKEYDIEWPVVQNLTETEKASLAKAMADVNRTAGFTVFTGDEMREKCFGLEPAEDEPTDEYKAIGAGKMALVNKMMGVTIFTPAEMRMTWYGWKPLSPDEAVPIAGPEKVTVSRAPAQAGDPNAVAEDQAAVVVPPAKPTVGGQPSTPNVGADGKVPPLAGADRQPPPMHGGLNPAQHGPTFGLPRAAEEAEVEAEFLRVLSDAIRAGNSDVVDRIMGTNRLDDEDRLAVRERLERHLSNPEGINQYSKGGAPPTHDQLLEKFVGRPGGGGPFGSVGGPAGASFHERQFISHVAEGEHAHEAMSWSKQQWTDAYKAYQKLRDEG